MTDVLKKEVKSGLIRLGFYRNYQLSKIFVNNFLMRTRTWTLKQSSWVLFDLSTIPGQPISEFGLRARYKSESLLYKTGQIYSHNYDGHTCTKYTDCNVVRFLDRMWVVCSINFIISAIV